MNNRRLLNLPLYALSALVIVGVAWAYRTRVDIAIRSQGVVRIDGDTVQVTSESGGRVVRVAAREGNDVARGDVLVQLDDRALWLKETAILSQIHHTEQQIAVLEERILDAIRVDTESAHVETAEADVTTQLAADALKGAEEKYERAAELFDEGLVPLQSLNEAFFALRRAEAERNRPLIVDLRRIEAEARRKELAAQQVPLRATLAAAYHDLEQTRIERSRLTITSPADGKVVSFALVQIGEWLPAGSVAAGIAPAGQPLVIEAWIPTHDRAFVSVGQKVRMQLESAPTTVYPGFDGTVKSISPDAVFTQSGAGAYRTVIAPAPFSPTLELGMTLQVHFITRQERLLALLFQKIRDTMEE